jgi:nucleotide-binding universal stress UspA family protein
MYRTILVPLDGSKRAEAILPHVEGLARNYGSQVVFLQVVEPGFPVLGPQEGYVTLYEETLQSRTEQAEAYLAHLRDEFLRRGISTRTDVSYAPAVSAILDAAKREDADLIAMASHGRTGLSRVFYGSVAAGVLHRIDRPLLLIRSQNGD